uniref:Uncharacterized protein n=1 Tax=Eiseniibacteriota bacterium TaxID=2212470 RepID=A0A832I1W8_UNCEI
MGRRHVGLPARARRRPRRDRGPRPFHRIHPRRRTAPRPARRRLRRRRGALSPPLQRPRRALRERRPRVGLALGRPPAGRTRPATRTTRWH